MTYVQTSRSGNVQVDERLAWFRQNDKPHSQIFDGLVTAVEFHEGLGLHTLNARARRPFEMSSVRQPGAVLLCFLEGSTEALLDGKSMGLGRGKGAPVKFVLSSVEEPLRFDRRSALDEYVRKISISLSHEWLDAYGIALPTRARHGFAGGHLEWNASQQDLGILEELAACRSFSDPFAKLDAEANVLRLLSSSFKKLGGATETPHLTQREQDQLARFTDLARLPGPIPSLNGLARASGLSPSSLRRLVQKRHGCAPLHFAKKLRLSMARDKISLGQMSVAEAAEVAGFRSAESFATAFSREFGAPPSHFRPANYAF
ncbi:helix-turn-helix transcriptional regulator [Shimia sp. MMG029]|uniref:helix-turn-helix transcriptional regulator n=1 Tax=Shimia sp. MMG029 TaxID=3021978 RepID=UPI0022FE8FBE|nr:AraC family transcriptional regulator [Shimia sp. MMG029]MDA5555434.1 AraC family transcriptional regulator [Shimia sp. MMG029]